MNIFSLLKKDKPAEFDFPVTIYAVTEQGEKPIVLPSEVSGYVVYDGSGKKILTAPKFVPDIDMNVINETLLRVISGVYMFGMKNGKGDNTPSDGDITVSAAVNVMQELIKRVIESSSIKK